MRRADRLFQIIQFLRTRRVTTAAWLAERLEVSERTIYRDIKDLVTSGVDIEGEAGIGYVVRRGFDLPPLMFNAEEVSALVLGARMVNSCADISLATAADSVLSKIETVLPDKMKNSLTCSSATDTNGNGKSTGTNASSTPTNNATTPISKTG